MTSEQVGAISKMPGLQSFCVGTAVGLAAIFLIQVRMIDQYDYGAEKLILVNRPLEDSTALHTVTRASGSEEEATFCILCSVYWRFGTLYLPSTPRRWGTSLLCNILAPSPRQAVPRSPSSSISLFGPKDEFISCLLVFHTCIDSHDFFSTRYILYRTSAVVPNPC